MAKFFIHRPIVAIVVSILMTVVGLVAMVQLPIAQFPNIAPPEIQLQATYIGADAVTLEQSVATPIEQQMNGVDNMLYMYSVNGSDGRSTLRVNFDVGTSPNTDQILSQMRYSQVEAQLPQEVRNYGVTVKKSTTSPLALFSLYSPNETYDNIWLANYAYININDPMSRVPGVGQVTIFGAGQYAMRFWVRPDVLAQLGITVPEILDAVKKQNTVNPSGQIGAEPVPAGQEFTYSVRAQGRLLTKEEFEAIVVRANVDGSVVRLRDVARVELGAQGYNMIGRMNGKPSAIVAIYQLPGSNAIQTMDHATQLMEDLKRRFPADLEYVISLDTTLSVREGLKEIVQTLWEALLLVVIVVFIFLQGWRATLIPLLAVPVSLVGTFMLFPLLGFSINTLSLFGLVLAICLVVDDAIVVVEAVEHHIEQGLSPKEATLKALGTGLTSGVAWTDIEVTRDELIEGAALLRAVRSGELDRIPIPRHPWDVLAQQIVALCVAEPLTIADLHAVLTRAATYADVNREQLARVVALHAQGRFALLHYDPATGVVRATRRARLTAVMSGGAIPDTAQFQVREDPGDIQVGTLDEDFSLESSPGDVFQLGNTSWRITKVEGRSGVVRVVNAHGAPPTIPFWIGEAPGRTRELSEAVGRLRAEAEGSSRRRAEQEAAQRILEDPALESAR